MKRTGLCSCRDSLTAHCGQHASLRCPPISTTTRSLSFKGRWQKPHCLGVRKSLYSYQPRASIPTTMRASTARPVFFCALILSSSVLHTAHRALQAAFGIDQEVAGNNDFFARFQSRQHNDQIVELWPHGDPARLEHAAVTHHENDLLIARIENGLRRHYNLAAIVDLQLRIGKHLRLQFQLRVRKLNTYLQGARLCVNHRVDVADLSAPLTSGVIAELQFNILAHMDVRNLVFVNVEIGPDG